ncbi:MAG: SCO family protein, partial [Planctomycetota bacterium]
AAETKANYVEFYNDLNVREGSEDGWHFLVGSSDSIETLSDQVGFRYVYDPETDEYAHASGIVLATPKGRLSGYFYGVEYITKDVRLGLLEAGKGTIGSLADKVLLLCYHYDPTTGKYGLAIMGIMRFLGALTVLVMAFSIVRMLRSERSGDLALGGSPS